MFIDHVYANSGAAATGIDGWVSNLIPIALILMIFYFLVIRPNDKRRIEQKKMIDGLKINSKIVTSTGILGIVKEIDDKEGCIVIETGGGSMITMLKDSVVKIVTAESSNKETSSKTTKKEITEKKTAKIAKNSKTKKTDV